MRFGSFFVVAVAALLVGCDDASPVGDSEQTAMVFPSTVKAIDGAPMTSARLLRSVKRDEGDDNDDLALEDEERVTSLKMLTPIDELLAMLQKTEAQMLASLNKYDKDILAKVKESPYLGRIITRWKEGELSPIVVARLLKRFPSLSKEGSEWSAWRLYAAQYIRQHNSLKPTV